MPHTNSPRLIAIIYLLLASNPLSAQTISGIVTNSKNQPMSAAVVTLCAGTDSTAVAVSITNKRGEYAINSSVSANALLKAEAQGYITEWLPVTSTNRKLDILLKANNTLSEVTVSSRKPLIEQKLDRTVFNVENSVLATGGDAYSALKKAPGVQIRQGQITIAGKGSVGVMLNGRLQQLTGEDLVQFLHSIPSDNLSKIEVITSPGAKYDAEGATGMINLVTKRNPNEGLRGSATAALTRNSYYSPSGNVSLQYRSGKLNLYGNANASVWNWVYTSRTMLHYTDHRWYQGVDQEYSNRNSRVQIGGDYLLSKKVTLGAVYTRGFGGSDNMEHIYSDVVTANLVPDSIIRTEGKTHETFRGKHTLNVNYEWRIDSSGRKLNIDADYFTQSTERARDFTVSNYKAGETVSHDVSDNRIFSKADITIRSVKTDLELPYSFARVAMGIKGSLVNNDGAFDFLTKVEDSYKPDSARANRFLYNEQIQAAYINAQKKIGLVELQAGLRVERTMSEGYTPATKEIIKRDYTNLFPSINMQYRFKENQSLTFAYTRRINRPGYNFLNPFRFYYSPTSYVEGNPELKPSFSHTLELTWFVNQKHSIKLRTNQVRNYWDRLFFTDSITGTSRLTRANVGNASFYSVSYNFSHSFVKWWEFYGNVTAEYSKFKLHAYDQNRTFSGVNGWVDVVSSFSLNKKKTLLAELHAYYYTPRQKDYKRWEEMSLLDGGIKALFLEKNLILGLNFEDPFAKAYWQQTNQVNGTTEYSYDDGRLVTFSVTFKFGNNNIRAKRDRSEAEEIQRAR